METTAATTPTLSKIARTTVETALGARTVNRTSLVVVGDGGESPTNRARRTTSAHSLGLQGTDFDGINSST